MDPYEFYKDKIGMRLASTIEEGLLQGKITRKEAEQIGSYILENIDLAKTNSDLFDFVTDLSRKWPIFNSILNSNDQGVVVSPFESEKNKRLFKRQKILLRKIKLKKH